MPDLGLPGHLPALQLEVCDGGGEPRPGPLLLPPEGRRQLLRPGGGSPPSITDNITTINITDNITTINFNDNITTINITDDITTINSTSTSVTSTSNSLSSR